MSAQTSPRAFRQPAASSAAVWMRGAVAAWQRPLAAAEAACAAGDLREVATLLRPSIRQLNGQLGGGRLWELWALCLSEGLGHGSPMAAFHQALQAYQDAHDVAGLARCHFALGELQWDRGDLVQAAREFGYAHELYARRRVREASAAGTASIESLACRGLVRLHAGDASAALQDATTALAACRAAAVPAATEATVRLGRAQILAAGGQPQAAARELLWAERLADSIAGAPLDAASRGFTENRARCLSSLAGAPNTPGAAGRASLFAGADQADQARLAEHGTGQGTAGGGAASRLRLALARAEGLVATGHPRRAATVLAQARGDAVGVEALGRRRLLAQLQRLLGEAELPASAAQAYTALQTAHRAFTAADAGYWRVACEIGLLRAALRTGSDTVQARLDALGHARLYRWPLLQARYERARQEVARPQVHVPGAVRAPWMGAVGHHHVGRIATERAAGRLEAAAAATAAGTDASDASPAAAGLFDKLQHAWGRWRHAPASRSA